ncbi:MAG: hypothetical protein ABSB76_32885 [Streptosporangiaceae bacterium]
MWDQIAAAVAITPASSPAAGEGTAPVAAVAIAPAVGLGASARRRTGMSWRRGRVAATVAGLAAGLIIGVGATAGVVQLTKVPVTHVVAQIELSPLPAFPQWSGVTGTAVMRATATEQ